MVPVFPVSDVTQKILKNFGAISNSLLLLEGQKQKTIGPDNTSHVLAYANFPESWPKETAIYNLSLFLGALSTFDKPAIQFEPDAMVISDPKSLLRIKHRYSNPTTVAKVNMKDKVLPTEPAAVVFTVSHGDLSRLKKASSLFGLPSLYLTAGNNSVTVTANDPKNPSSHAFDLTIPPAAVTWHDATYTRTLRFPVEYISKLMDGDYAVSLGKWPYAFFAHTTTPITYFVAEEATAKP